VAAMRGWGGRSQRNQSVRWPDKAGINPNQPEIVDLDLRSY
jgi:hypothetical protein